MAHGQYEWWIGAYELLDRSGVEPWEVMEVLYSPQRWPRTATGREGLSIPTVWGRTGDGRALVVVLRWLRADSRWQILLALPMRPRQLAEYTAWEANRDDR